MDFQKESEFNETMNLVKAVLERLEFHAFEDVLIWSNEHASKALLRCLKKTLSEFENGHLVLTSSYPKLKHFSVDSVVRGLMTALDQAQERQDNLNREINELEDQLAKAQAVPEEFILVPIKLPEDAIRNLARKRFEEGQEYCTNKFGQFNESNKERWIQDQMGIIKNLYIDFLRTFESL